MKRSLLRHPLTLTLGFLGALPVSRADTWPNPVSDGAELRQAVVDAPDNATITFDAPVITVNQAVVIAGKRLKFEGPVRLQGPTGGLASSMLKVEANARLDLHWVDLVGNINTSTNPGGAALNLGTLTLDECLVSGNKATAGGGIATTGVLRIHRSLIEGNEARKGDGGGIQSTNGPVTLESSTISGNAATARGTAGGGIALVSTGAAFVSQFNAVTVANNRADSLNGGVHVVGAGAQLWIGGSIVGNNIIYTKSGQPKPSDIGTLSSGKISSDDYNIVTKGGESLSPAAAHDQVNIDPMLYPLADNGGWTRTHALKAGSPALDRGDPDFLTLFTTIPPTDQRGLDRVAFGRADVGAFEYQGLQLSCPARIVAELAAPQSTPVTLVADLSDAFGGTYTVSWYILGTTEQFIGSSQPVTLPLGGGTVQATLIHGFPYQPGTSTRVEARVTVGTRILTCRTEVIVQDTTAPSITLINPDATIGLGGYFDVGAGAIVTDASFPDGSLPADASLTWTVNGVANGTIDACTPGTYTIVYTATDAGGNTGTATTTVTVSADNLVLHAATGLAQNGSGSYVVQAEDDPGNCSKRFELTDLITIEPNPPPCADRLKFVVSVYPSGSTTAASSTILPYSAGSMAFSVPVGAWDVVVSAQVSGVSVGSPVRFAVTITDPYNNCAANLVWKLALDLTGPGLTNGVPVSQYLSRAGESRWYKVKVSPGSQVHMILVGLPADYDIAVYRDIAKTLAQLNGALKEGDPALALLGVEFAAENYAAENYAAENYAAENYAAENYAAENYAAENYAAENYAAENYAAENYAAENYAAENYADANFTAENYAALFPAAENYAAENYAAENYAAAQQASLLVFSALPGTIADEIRFNTFTEGGEYYIRVRGKNGIYSAIDGDVFTLFLQVTEDVCSGVDDLNTQPDAAEMSTLLNGLQGDETSLILWDSKRIKGTSNEKVALQASLSALAAATHGFVVDVGAITRIGGPSGLNAQADANTACPAAKNLVAETIRNVILAVRARAPIEDITLIGNDDVIPFFRVDDEAQLASEANYYPPVKNSTQSQSSLRSAKVLTQDRYGSSCQVFLTTGPYDLPEIPVGRLVETAPQIKAYVDAYLPLLTGATSTGGVLPTPTSLFFSGYDFLSDAAEAVEGMLAAGLSGLPGGPAVNDTLISDPTTPPAQDWTAAQFETQFFAKRYDMAFLAGHFSTAGMLAADYTTRFSASKLLNPNVDLARALIFSIGCHSGYNTVNDHAVPIVTEQPDWAEAFAQKQAIWISGTAYQYGDTDTVEFSERLYVEFARALGAGSGPVRIGQALVEAKRRYLEETAVMRGIHEKTLQQVTLYGLPMLKLDLPGTTPAPSVPDRGVTGVASVAAGTPGASFGLKVGTLQFAGPAPTLEMLQLEEVGNGQLLDFHFLKGTGDGTPEPGDPYHGTVVLSGEPVRPLEVFTLSQPGSYARGVGFRSGTFTDIPGLRPLTGSAATEISGVKFKFATDVFYPIRPWNLNHTGTFCGYDSASRLNLFPGQFLSDYLPDGSAADTGTIRRFGTMNFDVFYSPEIAAADPGAITPEEQAQFTLAMANAPTANVLASTLNGDGKPEFVVEVAALKAVGVHEVWITYSILNPGGTGEWRSLTLNRPADPQGIGLWTGVLDDADADLTIGGELRFFVQAVNGVGAVSLNTNLGRFFRIGESTLDGYGGDTPTSLQLVGAVPTTGVYRDSVALTAKLESAGSPVPSQAVAFRVGPLVTTGFTDANGVANATIVLGLAPGSYPLEAVFNGDNVYAGSSSQSIDFTVTKRPTRLTFTSSGLITDASDVVVQLATDTGTPLKEKTVIFVVTPTSPSANAFAAAAITDGLGQARLQFTQAVAAGLYEVTARFGDDLISLPNGAGGSTQVSMTDALYLAAAPAQVALAQDVAILRFDRQAASVGYQDLTAPGATDSNRGHTGTELSGDFFSAELPLGPYSVLASTRSKSVTGHVRAVLSGKVLVDTDVSMRVTSSGSVTWRGETKLANGTTVKVYVDWDKPDGKGRFHVWIDTAPGSGPLYGDTPALLETTIMLGTGAGEHPAVGSSLIGGADQPWTSENPNSRTSLP